MKIFARDCASCHDPRGQFTSKVIPIAQIGTDPERMRSWPKAAAEEANRRVKELAIERPPMIEREPYGYLSPPLDGLWMRAPYLHNGSVPTLRDLLNPPNERPQTFHCGYDVYDPNKVGFQEPAPRPVGPSGKMEQRYFLYDTRRRGDGNGGHLYGTGLPPAQKEQLLEYLRTL